MRLVFCWCGCVLLASRPSSNYKLSVLVSVWSLQKRRKNEKVISVSKEHITYQWIPSHPILMCPTRKKSLIVASGFPFIHFPGLRRMMIHIIKIYFTLSPLSLVIENLCKNYDETLSLWVQSNLQKFNPASGDEESPQKSSGSLYFRCHISLTGSSLSYRVIVIFIFVVQMLSGKISRGRRHGAPILWTVKCW